ncbi:MAG: DUF853 domain-containing protein [Firmicutes bacterium HGW-Firmicutes-2]|nr:MAG: DUF853 domain-containing protein [Firmicutes bacterium HGW-Firmicutes-2]
MIKDTTYLGKVTNVSAMELDVLVSDEIPSAAPIIDGKQYRIGQIGTLVRIPFGNINLYGVVASVSNIETMEDLKSNKIVMRYTRHLKVNLIGEKIGKRKFQTGIGIFPTIDDEVHLVIDRDLQEIYGESGEDYIEIGKHSSSGYLPVSLDIHKLILRHSAILGSTGSGKSNTTAVIIDKILNKYQGSRIVLIDIHGEYFSAFPTTAKSFRINCSSSPLYIPFWAMTFDELSFFLVSRQEGSERPEDKRLREEIVKLKKENKDHMKSGSVEDHLITADSPIPFDLRKLWYEINREVNATYNTAKESEQNTENEELISEGDYRKLIPARFKDYDRSNRAPFKSKNQTMYAYEKKIYSRLLDNRFDFMFNPGPYKNASMEHDLDEIIRSWISNEQRLTILDLSGVPFELIDISVGLLTRLVYDSMFWGRDEIYTGRKRPLLLIYEEAHKYLPKNESNSHIFGYARKGVERIFKEGRKFGVGAMIVSQRPSEVSDTILSQLGTFISLRLTNSSDQNTIKASAPNNMTSLIDLLPSLRIGEGIVTGESIKIPSRVRVDLHEPCPNSNDPDLVESWKSSHIIDENQYQSVVTNMREQRIINRKEEDNGND